MGGGIYPQVRLRPLAILLATIRSPNIRTPISRWAIRTIEHGIFLFNPVHRQVRRAPRDVNRGERVAGLANERPRHNLGPNDQRPQMRIVVYGLRYRYKWRRRLRNFREKRGRFLVSLTSSN